MKAWQILILCTFFMSLYSKSLYNHKKSYVTPLTFNNFQAQITKIRETTKQVSIVHYYKFNDEGSKQFALDFDTFTNENRGIFKTLACDCDQNANICEKEKISKYPTVRVYPPSPIPNTDYEGDLSDTKKLMSQAAKYLESNIVQLTKANIDTFVGDSPSVPKVILFTDKKGTPMIYKSLSNAFDKKLSFGMVRAGEQQDLCERYNVKKYPKILVIKTSEKKPKAYNGEMKFMPIFEFLNIYSETFVPGGGSSADSPATKQWLTELVPELNYESANDICLKIENGLCVIMISQDKPDKKYIDVFKQAFDANSQKIQRGQSFKFMWLDANKQKAWNQLFNVSTYPTVVILNPGKRKRYLVHSEEITLKQIQKTIEKITGGDAKFTNIKGGELPSFEIIIPEKK